VRAAILSATQQIILDYRVLPKPGPGELLVRVAYVAICGSDLARFWGTTDAGARPLVFGHEFSGWVHTLGPGVTGHRLGEPVTVAPLLTCGRCRYCQSGQEHLCRQRQVFGRDTDGAAQEYVVVPAHRTYQLPPAQSLADGALVEPLAVAVHALRRAEVSGRDTVLVFGAGAIGLLAAQALKVHAPACLAIADINPQRLALARTLGIEAVVSERQALRSWLAQTASEGVSLVIEASGAPAVLDLLPTLLAPSGRAVLVGKFSRPTTVDLNRLLRHEADLRFSRYFTAADFETALHLLVEGRVQVSPLVQARIPASQLAADSGRVVMTQAKQVVRALLDWQEGSTSN
jgi:2-desacetyl-2-hydroxyethyl bacteriochlorophyllide A dehydrogenase